MPETTPIVQNIKAVASNFLKALGYKVSQNPPVSGASIAVTSNVPGKDISMVYAYDGTISNAANAGTTTQNTLFSIGSITKSVISFLLLRAIANSQGKMNLDDPLEKYFPQFNSVSPNPAWGKPTIRQLLNMTSGLPDYLTLDFDFYTQDPQKNWTLQEIISAMPQLGQTNFTPGTQYQYSNTNYILLGMLLEQVTGSSIQSLVTGLATEVGIENDFFYPMTLIPHIEELKHRYQHPINTSGVDVTNAVNPTILGSAGAIVATPSAVCKWINWLFNPNNNPYLSTMQQCVSMATGQPLSKPTENVWGYGLAIINGLLPEVGDVWMYQGETYGSTAGWYLANSTNLGAVVASYAANTEYTNINNNALVSDIFQARGAIFSSTPAPIKQAPAENLLVSSFLNYDTNDLCNTLKKTFSWFCCPLPDCDADQEKKTESKPLRFF